MKKFCGFSMHYRKLGKDGPVVSSLGLGCMGISENYGPADEKSGIEVIKLAYEKGINFFDTADMYGRGANELLLGKAIKSFRDQVIIATKCGIERIGDDIRFNNEPSYIKKACLASLQRLRVDYIDVYYLHRYNPIIPIEDSMQVMLELINEGKVRYVGLSEVDGAILERAHSVLNEKLVALQSEYSLVNRIAADITLPTCRKLGIAFVPFSPIGRGLLSGTITETSHFDKDNAFDFRSVLPQFQPEALKINIKLVDALNVIASKKKCTLAQLALAWLLAQGEDIIPIPGTKKIHYLNENMGAIDVHLSQEDLNLLEEAMKKYPVEGARYPDDILKQAYLKY